MTAEQLQTYELQERLDEVESRLSNAIRQSYRNAAFLVFMLGVSIMHPRFDQWLMAAALFVVLVETVVRRLVPPRRWTPHYSQATDPSPEQKQPS
jgi:hypothetical protein